MSKRGVQAVISSMKQQDSPKNSGQKRGPA
jgi:hypothetical protein